MSRKSDLTTKEKIAIVGCMVLGREYLSDAFAVSHPQVQTKAEASLKVMQSRWWASDPAKAFRQEITDRLTGTSIVTGNDLRSRDGIVSELITAVKQSRGKDAVSGLQSLAKLQGLDKPDEGREEEEKRRYFLPYRSRCRGCRLMQIYMDIEKENLELHHTIENQ